MIGRRTKLGLAMLGACCALGSTSLFAWQTNDAVAGDVERMVREGMVAALESRFSEVRTAEQLRLLALAQTNRASRIRDASARQSAFEDAERRFLAWIDAAEREPDVERVARVVNAAAARHALAGMILSTWSAADLDRFELTAGRQGDTRGLRDRLVRARNLYEEARDGLRPVSEELAAADSRAEERYLVLGVYDAVPRLLLDIDFNLAWTNLYLAMVDPRGGEGRKAGLRAAERSFQNLVDSGGGGETAARCRLGLAMALREQGRCDEAAAEFGEARRGADGALEAQIRYEWARAEIRAERFDEARVALRPLVEKDPDRLAAEDLPLRFYVNLAHLWDANSYMKQAASLKAAAAGAAARDALLGRARRMREIGLQKLNDLAARGGGWPDLVELHAFDVIDEDADVKSRGPAELLFSARRLSRNDEHARAIELLSEAAGREGVEPRLAGEILFEMGVIYYRAEATRKAAETFERVALSFKQHEKAPRAATYAYQFWAGLADDSKAPEDYRRLAGVILNILQSFPNHEKRDEAQWWLPVARQAAGDYQEAIESFGSISAESPQYAEARFRKAICMRLLFDQQRGSIPPTKLRVRASRVADELKAAANVVGRTGEGPRAEWAATALVSAAEVHVSSGVSQYRQALQALDGFEQRFPNSEQIGRALAARISAHRGLEQYDEAARVVEQFLRTVPPEQAGGTLGAVARGMQEEVDRLEHAGDHAAARRLAASAIPTFEQLDRWLAEDASRAKYIDAVRFGLARMRLLAGEHESAGALARQLLASDPRNGDYLRLNALALTAIADGDSSRERIAPARDAWGGMLRDTSLRTSAPQRYWEARYHFLRLLLCEGRAAEVASAIKQERVWYPTLGGEPWSAKLGELEEEALRRLNTDAEIPPPESGP